MFMRHLSVIFCQLNRQVHEYMKIVVTFFDVEQCPLENEILRYGFHCFDSDTEQLDLDNMTTSVISGKDEEDTYSSSYQSSCE